MIDMNKPYVGFLQHLPNTYQLYIVTWETKDSNNDPEYLAYRIGEPVVSMATAKSTLSILENLTGVQNAEQLKTDFFPFVPGADWRHPEHYYVLPNRA